MKLGTNISTIRGYAENKNHDSFLFPRHKMAQGHIEFTLSECVCVCLCVPDSCLIHYFIVHDGIYKSFDTNDHQDKTMCRG